MSEKRYMFLCPGCECLVEQMEEYWRHYVRCSAYPAAHGVDYTTSHLLDAELDIVECPECGLCYKQWAAEEFIVEVKEDGTIVPIGNYWFDNELPEHVEERVSHDLTRCGVITRVR